MDNYGELLILKPHDGSPDHTIPWLYDYIEKSDIITQKGVYEIVNIFIKNNEFVQLVDRLTSDSKYYYEVDLISKEIAIFKRHSFTHELELIETHKVQKTCENVNRWLLN